MHFVLSLPIIIYYYVIEIHKPNLILHFMA